MRIASAGTSSNSQGTTQPSTSAASSQHYGGGPPGAAASRARAKARGAAMRSAAGECADGTEGCGPVASQRATCAPTTLLACAASSLRAAARPGRATTTWPGGHTVPARRLCRFAAGASARLGTPGSGGMWHACSEQRLRRTPETSRFLLGRSPSLSLARLALLPRGCSGSGKPLASTMACPIQIAMSVACPKRASTFLRWADAMRSD